MITVVDYKVINLGSILNMLKRVGAKQVEVAETRQQIQKAKKIILPGIGSFDHAIKRLREYDMIDILKEKALQDETPFLGICLGMHIMTQGSDEGLLPGIGLIDAVTKGFPIKELKQKEPRLRFPHMGWNYVDVKKETRIFPQDNPHRRFYFAHSYYVECQNQDDILTTTDHGLSFASCFEHKNVIGTQFHPEKSHRFGKTLFKNFVENY